MTSAEAGGLVQMSSISRAGITSHEHRILIFNIIHDAARMNKSDELDKFSVIRHRGECLGAVLPRTSAASDDDTALETFCIPK